ncbi:MAG: hypothetical protein K0U41_04050 [Gammaproteobacteria bacterium]|nr:hypothetical protein [Gammaproteobacteria bacterium]
MGFNFITGGSGGGGARVPVVASGSPFVDAAARDTWAAANLSELFNNNERFTIAEVGSGVDEWSGEDTPPSYQANDWTPRNTLTALDVKTLYESNANTNVLTDAKNTILNALSINDDNEIVSALSWIFPPDTIYVSENLGIEGSGEAFAVFDRASDRRGYLVAYLRAIGAKPFFRDLIEENTNLNIQPLKDTDSGSQTFSSLLTLTENRLITKVYVEPTEDATGVDISLLRNSRRIASAFNVSFTADTIKEIDVPQGIFVPRNAVLEVQVEGVTLKGTEVGGNFIPGFSVDEFRYVPKDLATEEFVLNLINNQVASLSGLSINIPDRVDLDTDLNSERTINFSVEGSDQLTALELIVDGGDNITLTTPTSDGSQSQQVTLANIDTSTQKMVRFSLSATTSGGQTITSNTVSISVRNVQPHELLYYGRSDSNNSATIDISTLNSVDVINGPVEVSTGLTIANQFFIILIPTSATVESIIDEVLQQDVLSIFSENLNVRAINGNAYNSYTIGPLNAGVNETYTVNL